MEKDIQSKINDGIICVNQILANPKLYFSSLKPSDIPADIAGVYAIFDKDTGETLYVGRTKNLRRRLYTNHLQGSKANARLKKYFTEDITLPEISSMDMAKQYLKEKCYVQYIVEDDVRERGRIEGFLGFVLNVRYIHEEH